MGRLFDILAAALPGLAGDRDLLRSVDGKVREAMAGHLRARRALALAVAAGDREADRRRALSHRAAELEDRAVAAIAGGREDLAIRASEAIASLEAEVEASAAAEARQAAAVARLRDVVEDGRRRLADIERGRRLAVVRAAVGEAVPAMSAGAALRAAEDAMTALQIRQDDAAAVAAEMDSFHPNGDRVAAEMAEAGFGPAPRTRDVLERLRAKALGQPLLGRSSPVRPSSALPAPGQPS